MADITFAKKTTLDSLNSDISSYLSDTRYRIDVSKSVIDSSGEWESTGSAPQFAINIIYNNEIYGLRYSSLLKWDGVDWVSVDTTVPYEFYRGSVVVYNNEIHIMGGTDGSIDTVYKYHYKWDGSSWTSVSTLPYDFYYGSAVVYNNEIHILGGSSSIKYHYKWDGSSWTSVSTLPYNFYNSSAVVYNNEIHILGSYDNQTAHYKYDGSSWTSVSTLPYNFYYGSAVVYNNEIHILGGNRTTNHYKWNGLNWISVSTLPYSSFGDSVVLYNNKFYIMNGFYNSYFTTSLYSYAFTYSISYQLFQNMKIICDKSILTPISSNLSEITDGYEVTTTGLVQLQSSEPISETNRPLLTILS